MNPGLIGGVVGSIAGIAGGLIGTYFSIKNTKSPQERTFVFRAALVGWIFVLAFVLGMCLLPNPYKLALIPIYVIGLVAGILFLNRKQAQIRIEFQFKKSRQSPAVPPTQIISGKCPQCGTELKPDAPEGLCPACLLQRGIATEGGVPPGTQPFVPPEISELARLFPQLEILEPIGQGGMGAVYKARQPALDRLVALKILAPRSGGDVDFAERFTREARALAKLNHPNIVAVYDFGRAELPLGQDAPQRIPTSPIHYFIMEYVDGLNLRQVEQAGKLEPHEALQIIPQICAALQFAHDEGIVHRDIKPENILLDKKGRVKIADFGLAKIIGLEAKDFRLTGAHDVMGTPHYIAPEQVEHPQAVDHRADIYSLGVVFYEMLTGELPLGKFAPPSSCMGGINVDVRLDEVVLRSLEKDPSRRYQHASEVQTDVETITRTPAEPTLTPKPKKIMSLKNQKPLWYGLALGTACVVIGLATWLFVAHATGNASALTRQGWQLWQSQQLGEAAAKFREAVKLAPHNASAWNGLGWATFNAGNPSEAEKAFQKAVSIEPDQPGALNGLGQINLSQGKYDQAEMYLLKAAPRAPAAWYGLARIYLLEGKFAKAEKWAQQIVDSGQANDVVRQMLKAAQEKHLNEGLRVIIEPAAAADAAGATATSSSSQSAMAAIQAWLKLTDAGDYGKSWDEAADSFHDAVTKAQWVATGKRVRQPLGKVLSRKLSSTAQPTTLPGFPKGSYFVAKFDTAFASLKPATETVTFALTDDGQWKAIAYLIQPKTETTESTAANTNNQALPAVRAWLKLMDDGEYSQGWEEAADSFHTAVTKAEWVTKSKEIRLPLGKVLSRKLSSTEKPTTIPGMPYRSYFVARFDTAFANFKPATETVTFALADDNQWKAIAYLIQPGTNEKEPAVGPAEKTVVAAAKQWLGAIDSGHYAESWTDASDVFRGAITQDKWVSALEAVRKPLGNLISRDVQSAQLMTHLPGAPDGQYVVMQFATSFANKKSATETVTFMQGKDGQWRAAGYFVK